MSLRRLILTLPLRLRSLFRRAAVDSELDEEIQSHIHHLSAQYVAAGKSPDEARRMAMKGIAQRKEECRDARRTGLVDNLVRDTRYGLRTLARSPAFTLAALLALALGIGANTAVFSVVNSVLLRPLPYKDSDRIVILLSSRPEVGVERSGACLADLLDWRTRARSFQSIEGIRNTRYTISGDGEAEQIGVTLVTAGFFDTLGVRPQIGRTFASGEDQSGRAPTAVISDLLWKRRYNADPNILGRQILLNGVAHAVIGVMPHTFETGSPDIEVWPILTLTPPTRRGPFFIRGIARLKPGVTPEQAAAEMESIAREVQRDNPNDYATLHFPVVPLHEQVVGRIGTLLWVLTGAAFLVLLIAVFNVANLLLARATTRRREIAIRLSIGAGRAQLVRQFMTESLLLALFAAALGVGLAWLGVEALRWLAPRDLPRLNEIAVDRHVLAFTALTAILSAFAFGLAPAFASAGLNESLKQAKSPSSQNRVRSALVVAQVTLSVFLLIAAGLLIRSFNLLGSVPPGFHAPPDRVLTMNVMPSGPRYATLESRAAVWDQLLERVQTLPGVDSASAAITIPPNRLDYTDDYQIEGKPLPPGRRHPAVPMPFVTHDYFRTLAIPLLRGRLFDGRDRKDSSPVAVISDALARRHFAGEDPIGRRIRYGRQSLEIVGIVGDVKYRGLQRENEPALYQLTAQDPQRSMWLMLRTQGDASLLAAAVRREIRSLDPTVPVDRISTMEQAISESVSLPRFRSLLMTVFAGTALLLAAIGIYGVIAYSVSRRTQEIGVRMALGATRTRILQLVIGQGGRLAAAGIALGLAGSLAFTRLLGNMLYGVSPSDAKTFTAVALLLGTVAVLACLIPASRASRIDPVNALRQE